MVNSPSTIFGVNARVFIEIERDAAHGTIGDGTNRARLAEDSTEFKTRRASKEAIRTAALSPEMVDNARFLMATRQFLCGIVHIALSWNKLQHRVRR